MSLVKRTSSRMWLSSATFSFLLVMWAIPLNAAYRITDLECSAVPGGVMVTIEANGAVSQSAFTIGEPEPRLVVDLSNAVHSLPRYRYEHLGTDLVTRIRTSQYLPYPKPVVRLVLDMPELVAYEMKTQANKLMIVLRKGVAPSAQGVEAPPEFPASASRTSGSEISADSKAGGRAENLTAVSSEPKPDADKEVSLESQKGGQQIAKPPDKSSQPKAPSVSSESTPQVPERQAEMPDPSEPQKSTLLSRLLALGIREPISYSSDGRRDPFVALPTGQEVDFGETPLPDVEKLSIVGILKGMDGYRALVQDDNNNGYVLRKGDRVLYGYVVRIETERIVFRLNRRGLDRTIILKLPQ